MRPAGAAEDTALRALTAGPLRAPDPQVPTPGAGSDPAASAPGSPGATTPSVVADPALSTLGDAFATYWNLCAKPRTGNDPATGQPYPDKQGTLRDELTRPDGEGAGGEGEARLS